MDPRHGSSSAIGARTPRRRRRTPQGVADDALLAASTSFATPSPSAGGGHAEKSGLWGVWPRLARHAPARWALACGPNAGGHSNLVGRGAEGAAGESRP